MTTQPTRITPRTAGMAIRDAWPDVIAALACAIAWIQPERAGFDLLMAAGLLYFIELPLALITSIAIVRRIRDAGWGRTHKIAYVLAPTVVLAALVSWLLGAAGAVAIALLGGRTLLQLWRDPERVDGDFAGMWLKSTRKGSSRVLEWTARRPSTLPPGVMMIPAGHEHLMAFATIVTWFAIMVLIALLPPLGEGGATAAYAIGVGWTSTPVGQAVPAHLALAAGLLLFGVRSLLHFEGIQSDAAPAPIAADDAVLREVIEAVEGRSQPSRKTPPASSDQT